MQSFLSWNEKETQIKDEESSLKFPYKGLPMGELDEVRRLEKEFNIKCKKVEFLKEELNSRQNRLQKLRSVLLDLRQRYALMTNVDLGVIKVPRIIDLSNLRTFDKIRRASVPSRPKIISTKIHRRKFGGPRDRRSSFHSEEKTQEKTIYTLENSLLDNLKAYRSHGSAGEDLTDYAKEIGQVAMVSAQLAFETLKELRNTILSLEPLEFGIGVDTYAREADACETRLLEFRLNIDQLIQDLVHDTAILLLHKNLSGYISKEVEGRGLEISENATQLKNNLEHTENHIKNISNNVSACDKELTRMRVSISHVWQSMNSNHRMINEILQNYGQSAAKLDRNLYYVYRGLCEILNEGLEMVKNDASAMKEIASYFSSDKNINTSEDWSQEELKLWETIDEVTKKFADVKERLNADRMDQKWFLHLIAYNKEDNWDENLEVESEKRQIGVSQLHQRKINLSKLLNELKSAEKLRLSKLATFVEKDNEKVAHLIAIFNMAYEVTKLKDKCLQIQDRIIWADPLNPHKNQKKFEKQENNKIFKRNLIDEVDICLGRVVEEKKTNNDNDNF